MEAGDRRTGIGGAKTDLGPLSSDFRPLTFSGRRPMSVYVCLPNRFNGIFVAFIPSERT